MSERYEGEPDACWLCGDTDMHPLIACPSGNYLCADCCGPEEACFVCGRPRDGHVHTLTVDDDAPRRPRLESGSWQWRGCTTSAEEWIPGTWASSTTGYPRGVYVPPRGRSPFGAWYIQCSYQGPLCLPCDEPTGVDECTAVDAVAGRRQGGGE